MTTHLVNPTQHDKYRSPADDQWVGVGACRKKNIPWEDMTRDPTVTSCPACRKTKAWKMAMEGRRDLSRGVDA
jgi:hypothetical protein